MKHLIYILFISLSITTNAQIDYTKLIIGRNTGLKTFYNGDSTRIFGFAESLGEAIDIPGPTIRITEGDSVMIDFWNVSQGAPHTIHLHGLDVDQQNDGVPALSFTVGHMDHGFYVFKAPHPGTYLYHCHVVSSIHVQAGMYGVMIVEPSSGTNVVWNGGEAFDRDLLLTTSEIDTLWHNPDVLLHDTTMGAMIMVPETFEPQFYLVNGITETNLADPLNHHYVGLNEKVYIRSSNIGYMGVRHIFPSSLLAKTISSDGRPLPTEVSSDTVELHPGERFGTLIQVGTDSIYPITTEFFDLNTQNVMSTQTSYIHTSAASIIDLPEPTISVYPNPSHTGIFHITGDLEQAYHIYDSIGRILQSSQDNTFDLSDQSKGIYIMRYQDRLIKLINY